MHSCDQLLLDLGQTAGLPQPLRFDPHGCARLTVDNQLAIDFERDTERAVIHVYSVLAVLPAQEKESVYQQLLEANLFGAETAGASLAIDANTREIVLCRSVSAEGTPAAAFVQLVEQFITAAEDWKTRLAQQPSSSASAGNAAADAPAQHLGKFLRA